MRPWLRVALSLGVLGGVAYVLLVHLSGVGEAWAVARALRPEWVAAAVVAEAASVGAAGLTMRRAARLAGEDLALGRAVGLTLASTAVGALGGGAVGGSAAVYRWLRRSGASAGAAALVGAAPPLLNAVTIGAASVLGIGVLLPLGRLAPAAVSGLAVALVVLLTLGALVLWGARHPERLERWTVRVTRPLGRIRETWPAAVGAGVRRAMETARTLRRGGQGALAADAVSVTANAAALGCLFAAAGHAVAPEAFLAGYALPFLLVKVSVIPGGLGEVEGGMAGLFVLLGVPAATAVAVVLAFRALTFWVPVALGAAAAVGLERRSAKGKEENDLSSSSAPPPL